MYFVLPILLIFSIPALITAWREFQREKINKEIEKTLPDLLLSISALPASAPFEKTLAHAASLNSPAARPFKKCQSLLSSGMPVAPAISTSFSPYSQLTKKTGELFSKLYTHGNGTFELIREFALELAKHNEAKEALKADSSIQKYSILISSAFLVPFIIALVYSVSSRAALILPGSRPVIPANVVFISINLYLLALCFLSAKFLSKQFSTHFITFFSITAPLSLLLFNLSLFLLQ